MGDKYVVTAAHCVTGRSPSSILVRVGDTNLNSSFESKAFSIPVANVKLHPNYIASTSENDIAVLELLPTLDLSQYPHIKPVCLPDQGEQFLGTHELQTLLAIYKVNFS